VGSPWGQKRPGTGKPLPRRILLRLNAALARRFPEKRLFLRSDTETRFIRLTPGGQLLAWTGGVAIISWSIIATAFLLIDTIGSGNLRQQALREQHLYEARLNELSKQRDLRAEEAATAEKRFNVALEQVSKMQLALLASEDRRKEMERGLEVIQATLKRTMKERDAARAELAKLTTDKPQTGADPEVVAEETAATADFLLAALEETAIARDKMVEKVAKVETEKKDLELERKLMFEKNDRIFSQLEDAITLSAQPLDKMFRAAGLPVERILSTVRQGYSGQGGPMTPIVFSTRGTPADPDTIRANAILNRLDKLNLYRIAAEKIPLVLPLKSAFRYTSGFGPRWGRMHYGTDMASSYGTPVYATADGVVKFAGWSKGYGRLIKIQHQFGIETRFAHLAKIRVKVGQRVSRGDRIGDMGNSGHSTGTHLHYEIRENGKAVNAMKFIKAGRDVF